MNWTLTTSAGIVYAEVAAYNYSDTDITIPSGTTYIVCNAFIKG